MIKERIYRFARGLALICAVAVLAAPQGACTQFQQFAAAVSQSSTDGVPVKTFATMATTFDGAKRVVTIYLQQPICDGTRVACLNPEAVPATEKWMAEATTQRDGLKKFFRDHPNTLGPSGAFDAFKLAVASLQSLIAKYNMEAAS